MVNGILGKKIGMTQIFDDKGEVHSGDQTTERAVLLISCVSLPSWACQSFTVAPADARV